jgi:hypothetical protein
MVPVIRPEAYGMAPGAGEGYSAGRGQIRTNQFVDAQSWTLREFHLDRVCSTVAVQPKPTVSLTKSLAAFKKKKKRKLAKKALSHAMVAISQKPLTQTTCKLYVRPAPVAGNPFPDLFTGDDPDALLFQGGPDDEASFLSQLAAMIPTEPNADGSWPTETVNDIAMATDPRWNAAESIESGGDADHPLNRYEVAADSAFDEAIAAELPAGSPYAVQHIVNRATAASCGGCHRLSGGFIERDLGNGVAWDPGIFFTHVDRFGSRSDIMNDHFLPHRQSVMARYLAATCDECSEEPLLRADDGEFLTTADLAPNASPEKGGALAAPAPTPTLAKDVVVLGGKATLSGSLTH